MIDVDPWSFKCARCGWEVKSQLTVNRQRVVAETLTRLHLKQHDAPSYQKYIPTPAMTAWLLAEGFVPSHREEPDSGYWEKAWDHSSGYDRVLFLLAPWDGIGGFTGETFSAVVGVHASGTNPRINIGICHSLDEIISVYTALSAMTYARHQAFKNAKMPVVRLK